MPKQFYTCYGIGNIIVYNLYYFKLFKVFMYFNNMYLKYYNTLRIIMINSQQ